MTIARRLRPDVSYLLRRLWACTIDAVVIAFVDCALMYVAWLVGMSMGLFDTGPTHWVDMSCSAVFFFIDGMTVLCIPASAVFLNLSHAWESGAAGLANLFLISCVIANWMYHVAFECSSFQATPGKLAAGLTVVNRENYQGIDFSSASSKHWAKAASTLAAGLGLLPIWGESKKNTFHELISDCRTVRRADIETS